MTKVQFDLGKGFIHDLETFAERIEDALTYAKVDVMYRIQNEGLDIVRNNAQQLVYDPESLPYCMNNNNAYLKPRGNKFTVTITNSSQKATYAEFGTGMIGKQDPHPEVDSYGQMGFRGGSWEYYVEGKTPNYKVEVNGVKGWFHKGKFQEGMSSQPFYYKSSKDIQIKLPQWFSEAIDRALWKG